MIATVHQAARATWRAEYPLVYHKGKHWSCCYCHQHYSQQQKPKVSLRATVLRSYKNAGLRFLKIRNKYVKMENTRCCKLPALTSYINNNRAALKAKPVFIIHVICFLFMFHSAWTVTAPFVFQSVLLSGSKPMLQFLCWKYFEGTIWNKLFKQKLKVNLENPLSWGLYKRNS